MNAVGKAIWFIESRFSGELSLDEIAGVAGVSRYHLVRAVGLATGFSVMRYVRGRRLTQAAQSLSNLNFRKFSPTERPTFSPSRWMPATALMKHSRAPFASNSGLRPRPFAPGAI